MLIFIACALPAAAEPTEPVKQQVAFTLRCRQASLVAKRAPTCMRLDPVSGRYERVQSEATFGQDGRCDLQLPSGTYRFEVLAFDAGRKDFIAIRAFDQKVGPGANSVTLPDASRVTVRFSVDGTTLNLRQLAIRSIAETGEVRWVAGERVEPAPELHLSPDPNVQLSVVATGERWTTAYWWRGQPTSLLDFRLRSGDLNVCEAQPGPGDPSIRSGTGRMRFPDCTVDFPIRAGHRFATNRATGLFGYELEAAGDRLIVAVPARMALERVTPLRIGGPLRARPWAIAAWQDDGKFYPFFEGALVDRSGRELDLWRSRIKYKAKLQTQSRRDIPDGALTDEWRKAFDAPTGRLTAELAWSWGEPQTYSGTPDAWVEMKSEHFTLKAPPVWQEKAANYLAILERSHASWRKQSGRRGPILTSIGWRRNTHNAKAQVGGDRPWMSVPFKGLREAISPYDFPWFLVHEMGHTFGYHHGPTMEAGERAVHVLNDRERWKEVDRWQE